MMKNEELEKLKKSADLSQNLLIEKVESLVRAEYDQDLIEKEAREKIINQIMVGISSLTKDIYDDLWDLHRLDKWGAPYIGDRVKSILHKIGEILRNSENNQNKEISRTGHTLKEYDKHLTTFTLQ